MTLPERMDRLTLPRLLLRQAEKYPDRDLAVDPMQRYTFGGFAEEMMVLARAAMAVGVVPGDRVAVWAPNSVRWLLTAMGASAAGALLVPMNTRFKAREAWDVVQRVRPTLVFTTRAFLGIDYPAMIREIADGPVGPRLVVLDADVAGVDDGAGDLSLEDFRAASRAVSHDRAVELCESQSPDGPSDVILTSGTTGFPKGVLTSHTQNIRAWWRYARHIGLGDGERISATLPFFHNTGLKAGFLLAALLGGACICDETFEPTRLARLIERERISFLPATPTLFISLLEDPACRAADLRSLRNCSVAGAMVPVDLIARMQNELGVEAFTGYGLSELAGGIALTPPGAPPERVAKWAGNLVEGVEVRIVDDQGTEVPPGTAGEILARGEAVMLGYLDDPLATAATIDDDGWLHTGDIGAVEGDYLKLIDRKKDMFTVGGFNAYPAEIEKLLLAHPDLVAAAVIGIPDPRMGEVAAAFVVPRGGVDLTAAQVVAWARENMSNYKAPRRVVVVPQLPLNSSLKVVKDELRALFPAPD